MLLILGAMMMEDMKHTTGHQEQGQEEEERKLIAEGKLRKEENLVKENRVEEKGKPRKEKGKPRKGNKYINIYIYMNNNKYINPSCKLLKEMTKLSKYELHVLSKNYKKFIDNIKTKDKIKQVKIEKDRYDY